DRSLNTISLAGISFAVGMLLDSAIVVLENIDRHRKMGKKFFEAAYDGANEVWGALIASALTTIAVFLPIIFLQDEAGQLFKDIAIAVTSAITFSLFVSISVIPMIWTQIMKFTAKHEHTLTEEELKEKHDHQSLLVDFGRKVNNFLMKTVTWSLKSVKNQFMTVGALGLFSILTIYALFPKMEYLPQGNQNFILNILLPPPGLSYKEGSDMGEALFSMTKPHFSKKEVDGVPPIKQMFYVFAGDFVLSGITSTKEQRAREIIPMMIPKVNSFPGVFGISLQSGVFEQGIGEGRSINVDITGENIEQLANIGGMLYGAISGAIPGSQIRPVPSIELLFPEAKITPDRFALNSVGLNSTSFGFTADVLLDGRKIDEYTEEGKKSIDLTLKADNEISSPEELYNTQIATPSGGLVPMSTLSKMERTTGITKIRHYQGKRTITLQITPPYTMTLEEAMNVLDTKILKSFGGNPMVKGVDLSLSGQADKLTETVGAMKWNLLLAILIIYLLMSALFGNFIYPLVILFTVPMAAAGGFIGLSMTNLLIAPQALDVLTMLGFIILIGIVVNNAILIVHQSLNNIRVHKQNHKDAVLSATHSRLRPIFMSSLTSVFGMLPLVLVPGPGSEFYRGLGSVITGGLAFSTLFTIFVTPALLYFVIKMEKIKEKIG
ncbi:MAG: efflux RND transporter permease subunit, partial [Campylobacterales bacterium]|nr:efflux RND transporter permease subunit [Campylobacterales bacterium]